MKRKVFKLGVAVIASLAMLQGCSNYKAEIKVKTSEFLAAYFNGEYEQASTFCTDSLSSEITKMISGFESLDPTIQEMVKKQASGFTTEIVSIERSKNRDTVIVNYKLTMPFIPQGIDNSLFFVSQEKEWKVARLGAN